MITVTPIAEPADFDAGVRKPGASFLHATPHPTSDEWRRHDYWRRVLGDLLVSYRNICSYSGSWTKANASGISTPQDSSVDHFIPKSVVPFQAYEWSNFRLSRARLNNRKGDHQDVLDPFTLPGRWFTLDFRSFLIFPSDFLLSKEKEQVQKTIDRLRLNTDNDYVQERVEVISGYCLGKSTLATIEDFWPFIASEMKIQDFDAKYFTQMRRFFLSRP